MDFHPHSNYHEAYQALAPNHPVVYAPGNLTGTHCYKTAVFPVVGYGSPFFVDERADECRESELLIAIRQRLLAGYGLLDTPIVAQPRITIIHRSDYRGRINDKRLLEDLQKAYGKDSARLVSFEKLTFRKQLELIRATNILIGVHGAGMTHLLWLPRGSAVIELFTQKAPRHYRNLAHWLGLTYVGLSCALHSGPDPVKFMFTLDGLVKTIQANWKSHMRGTSATYKQMKGP